MSLVVSIPPHCFHVLKIISHVFLLPDETEMKGTFPGSWPDHGRRRTAARLLTAAAIVDPIQNPRVGSMVYMHCHPPASLFGEQGRFGCVVHRRITGRRRATPRRRDGLERRPSP